MQRGSSDVMLSAVFVDYDNIYLSLRRKNERAAKLFAKNASRWLAALQSGELIKSSTPGESVPRRRLVMNRCYGNPFPRKNQNDGNTDMSSFPFVRHNFLKTGFEIIDCPPLTAQLKNSSDIKMVMDLRDFLTHETYFNEFIILSSDADFTPVLHRLRAHNRRTVIFSNDNAAAAYTALADGAVYENDLISFLLDGVEAEEVPELSSGDLSEIRASIIEEVTTLVREAPAPVALEALAERTTRSLGHDKTAGSNWGGVGGFLELLKADLPDDIRLTGNAPYFAYDLTRVAKDPAPAQIAAPAPEPAATEPASTPVQPSAPAMAAPNAPEPAAQEDDTAKRSEDLQRSVNRILDASQVPPLARPEYRAVFEELFVEIEQNQLQGVKTVANLVERLKARGVILKAEDARFIIDVVSETDPWFEQPISPNIFAGRFRNFVAARCKGHGLTLSSQELDLIEMWFAGSSPDQVEKQPSAKALVAEMASNNPPADNIQPAAQVKPARDTDAVTYAGSGHLDDMPRIVRSQSRT